MLNQILLWTATGVLIITSGLLVYSFIRLEHQTAAKPEQEKITRSHPLLDLLWLLIPVLILAALLVFTFQAL